MLPPEFNYPIEASSGYSNTAEAWELKTNFVIMTEVYQYQLTRFPNKKTRTNRIDKRKEFEKDFPRKWT